MNFKNLVAFQGNRIKKSIAAFMALIILIGGVFSAGSFVKVNAADNVIDYLGTSVSFGELKNLRFKFNITNENLQNAKEYGALITNAYDLGAKELQIGATAYVYTKAVAFSETEDIESVFSRENNAVQYAVSVNGIAAEDFDKIFCVRPYVIYNDNTVKYGDAVSKSVYDVAAKVSADANFEYTSAQRGEFSAIAEKYVLDEAGRPVNLSDGNVKTEDVQKLTNEKVNEIRNSTSDYTANGTVYYVSESGNDSNSGKTEEAAWKTLSKVNSVSFSSGDVVLFKRGDTFRGQLTLKDGVTYSAYGEGNKPHIYGSAANAANTSDWTLLNGTENIWVYKNKLLDVGYIVLNSGEETTIKVAPKFVGGKFVDADDNDFDIVTALDKNNEFFSECNSVIGSDGYPVASQAVGNLYFYCDKGNPGEVFDSIEFCTYGNIITGTNTKNVTIDNLEIKYGGSHAIGTSNVKNFNVRNCEISWAGGSISRYTSSGKPARYGNGVQVHSSADGFNVENNYIYQIFDAGITHQQGNLLGTTCEFKNIVYQNNVIEKCAWSVEYYMNTPNAGFTHKMSNITINDNIMRLAGYGYGQYRDDEWHYPCHIMSWWLESEGNSNNADVGTFSITGNIFDRSRTSLIEIHAEAEKSLPVLSGNTYIQSVNGAYGRYSTYEMNYHTNQNYCNHNLNIKLGSIANETDAKLYFTDYTDVISDKALAQIDYFRENPVSENHTFAVTLANKKTVRNLKVLENGVRITETEIDSLKNDANSESVKIAFFADTHFVGTLTESDKEKQHLVDLYELRKNTFRNTVNSTPVSLAFGDLFDRTVIGGDLFDFYSEGNMTLYKSVVSDNYPDVLTLLGNHEAAEGFSGISPETPTPLADIYADLNERIFGYGSIKTQGSFETLEQAEQFNDIYLAHNLVKDSKGNEKALLLMMDDQNYTYQFDEFHFDRLEFYFQYAKENKIPILIFQHVPLCTGNATEIISPYDVIKNGNGVGSNWGLSGSPALPGHSYHDTHHPMTNRVYDLITNNADVVKGVFTGHEHNNIYTEIVAKNSDGTSAIIPQYTIAGNYFYSNINLITVK